MASSSEDDTAPTLQLHGCQAGAQAASAARVQTQKRTLPELELAPEEPEDEEPPGCVYNLPQVGLPAVPTPQPTLAALGISRTGAAPPAPISRGRKNARTKDRVRPVFSTPQVTAAPSPRPPTPPDHPTRQLDAILGCHQLNRTPGGLPTRPSPKPPATTGLRQLHRTPSTNPSSVADPAVCAPHPASRTRPDVFNSISALASSNHRLTANADAPTAANTPVTPRSPTFRHQQHDVRAPSTPAAGATLATPPFPLRSAEQTASTEQPSAFASIAAKAQAPRANPLGFRVPRAPTADADNAAPKSITLQSLLPQVNSNPAAPAASPFYAAIRPPGLKPIQAEPPKSHLVTDPGTCADDTYTIEAISSEAESCGDGAPDVSPVHSKEPHEPQLSRAARAQAAFLANLPTCTSSGAGAGRKRGAVPRLLRRLEDVKRRASAAANAAMQKPCSELLKGPHIVCQLLVPPLLEGHVLKLFCQVLRVSVHPPDNCGHSGLRATNPAGSGGQEGCLAGHPEATMGSTSCSATLQMDGIQADECGMQGLATVAHGGNAFDANTLDREHGNDARGTIAAADAGNGGCVLPDADALQQGGRVFLFLSSDNDGGLNVDEQPGKSVLVLAPWRVVQLEAGSAVVLCSIAVRLDARSSTV